MNGKWAREPCIAYHTEVCLIQIPLAQAQLGVKMTDKEATPGLTHANHGLANGYRDSAYFLVDQVSFKRVGALSHVILFRRSASNHFGTGAMAILRLSTTLLIGCLTITLGSCLCGSRRKVNCRVSPWSSWVRNNDHTRTRTREITRYPKNNGSACPNLIETQKDVWMTEPVQTKAVELHNKLLIGRSTAAHSSVSKREIIPGHDILFLIEMSGSIGPQNFKTAKENVADLVGKLCGEIGEGPSKNRFAVVTFATKPVINFEFGDYKTVCDVKLAIMKIKYGGGGTNLAAALESVKALFRRTGIRYGTVQEVVILTDGEWNGSPNDPYAPIRLARAISAMHGEQNPISIYAFAIGSNSIYDHAIDRLVTEPIEDYLFTFPNMDDFNSTVDTILTFPESCAPIVLDWK